MNGIHDMGGMHGFGRVVAEPGEPVFHARWEGLVRAIFERTNGRYYKLDEFRRAMEQMAPGDYLRASYYTRWLYAIEAMLTEKGVVSADELAGGRSARPAPRFRGMREAPPPLLARFNAGDQVVTRNLHPASHTRIPRYARGKRGVVRTVNGPWPLPDANAHGRGPAWQPCYAVEFSARELWGDDANGRDSVCVDLWESYLEPESTA